MRHRPTLFLVLVLAVAASSALADSSPRAARAPAHAAPATAKAAAKPLTPDERAIADRQLAGQQQVQAALVRLAACRDDASRLAVQREIVALKQQTELDVLGLLASQARAKGDLTGAQALDAQAAALRQPARATGPVVEKPAPDAAARTSTEGGRK